MDNKPLVMFLVGPTAVGKSAVAINLAKAINAEIISCDSMQIYKKIDILSSKPSLAERKQIKHHLIDEVDLQQEYNVSKYRLQAIAKISEVLKRRKIPLFVGGTGLYMSILIDGLFKIKRPDKAIRLKLYREVQSKGSVYLHQRLKKIDPQAAVKIHPNDAKRIIRALEVFATTGKPISELQKLRKGLAEKYKVKIFALNIPKVELDQKIDQRVDRMFKQGLLKEVKALLKLKLSKTAKFAIGINEIKGYLDGDYDLSQAKSLIQKNTRAYAKRQFTWFRKDKRIHWINIDNKIKPRQIVKIIVQQLSAN